MIGGSEFITGQRRRNRIGSGTHIGERITSAARHGVRAAQVGRIGHSDRHTVQVGRSFFDPAGDAENRDGHEVHAARSGIGQRNGLGRRKESVAPQFRNHGIALG